MLLTKLNEIDQSCYRFSYYIIPTVPSIPKGSYLRETSEKIPSYQMVEVFIFGQSFGGTTMLILIIKSYLFIIKWTFGYAVPQ